MVRPVRFAHNAQTSDTNRFQRSGAQSDLTSERAAVEFAALSRAIDAAGIGVCVIDDTPTPEKPDAVFPNNWISFHRDGTVVLYPMLAPNRRAERRLDVLAGVEARLKFRRRRLLDLSVHEREGRFLEGTGSLVLDHVHRIAYACRSARTDESLVRAWAQQMNFQPIVFDALGADGTPIYHTNVLMSIGSHWAVVCTEAIATGDRAKVQRSLRKNRDVIEITLQTMAQFGANVLELRGAMPEHDSRSVLVLSDSAQTAFQRLKNNAWKRLNDAVDQVLPVAVPTIESVGGGGVRCMLAEVPEVTT
jgi:hypothetical protein